MRPRPDPAPRRPPPRTRRELLLRAEALAGHTVGEVAAALTLPLPEAPGRAKGFVGTLVELALGADATAGARPDFPALGVELKTIPVRAGGRPAESTFCCSITMVRADLEDWPSSRLAVRLGCVLFVPVEDARARACAARRFGAPVLWQPDAAELALLRADWEDLIGAIGSGRVPSAHEGRVLQVRPKAARGDVRVLGTAGDGPGRRQPLGLYLRARFTATILARGAGTCAPHIRPGDDR
jgi:DNA mismatch repair protein MutH